ncbi:MAG: TetR/AcrR family transcriptional regulator [Acidimicrobiia bacterium]
MNVDTVNVMEDARPTRERLLAAARAILDERGLEGLSLREIAKRAEVSHAAPARHFPNLASLLAAVAAEGFVELRKSVEEHVSDVTDTRGRIAAAGRGYVAFALANPGVFGLMFRPERYDTADPAYVECGLAAFQQLVDLVADAQRDGWRDTHAALDVATVVWSAVHGMTQLWLHGALQGATGRSDLSPLHALMTEVLLGPEPKRRRR